MSEKRLFLLDAFGLIYRAYYALIRAPRITTYGMNTSAIFGFCNTLDEVIRKENPTHIAACFDPPGGHTFRHEIFPEYKANREKQPEDITASIPVIKEILGALNIPVVELEDYEADDVIGTLTRAARSEGFTTYMMTLDKDYGQLITPQTLWYRPSLRGEGFEIRGPEQIEEKYGISTPAQIVDLLALEGDTSDNIPGCPGIGEKGAVKLINEWGSVENLIAHVDDLKGATRRKVSENARLILLSKELATIRTDVPLGDISPDSLVRCEPDYEKLAEIYRRLEFRTFLKRLPAQDATPAPEPPRLTAEGVMGSLFDDPVDNTETVVPQAVPLVSKAINAASDTEVNELVDRGLKAGAVGLALKATGTTPMTMTPMAMAVAVSAEDVVVVEADRFHLLKPLLESAEVTKVSHDVKTMMIVMRNAGIRLAAPWFDTSVAHYLLEPEMNHDLRFVAVKYAGVSLPDNRQAALEASVALTLHEPLLREIDREGLRPLLDDIELPLIQVLAAMERTGVRIDPRELNELSKNFTARMHALENEAFEIAGTTFNVGSPMQVGEILFERLKIDPKAKRTKKGAYSTTEEILEKYRADHPIAGLILDIRALKKLLATYVNALPGMINPKTGKIHTTYNQTVTATGRISSTNPNLQNIPVRSDDGKEIRRAFIPDPGDILLSADYSQIELRLIADISRDENMIEAFHSGHDIHRATAAKIYHLPLEEVGSDLRRNAKTANFGIIYGISAFGLSERLGIPRGEAKELIEGYFRTYPQIREYMDRSIADAREKGYVKTVMGRKRVLSDINSRNATVRGYAERNAINAPIQGSAADIIKRAMIDIFTEMRARGMRSRMIMQVHDELIFNVKPEELADVQELVTRCMEGAYHGRVALEVSSGVGANWLEAH